MTIAVVAEPQIERVVLELSAGEPLSGRVLTADGTAEAFRGWLELAGKLERMRPASPSENAGSPSGS